MEMADINTKTTFFTSFGHKCSKRIGAKTTMKKITFGIISYAMLCCIAGCGLFGPSDEDVIAAVNPAMAAFASLSIDDEDLVSQLQYQDSTELSYENEYQTVMQQMTFQLDKEKMFLSLNGVCTLDDYHDEASGYLMSGTIEYDVSGYIENQSDLTLEMVYKMEYQGGTVKSITFSMNDQTIQGTHQPLIYVNGKEHEFDSQIVGRAFRSFYGGLQSG